jgi:hypothetical protein
LNTTKKVVFVVMVMALCAAAFAQDVPASAPAQVVSKKQIVFFTAANVGASIFNARASWYGAHQCVSREELSRDPRGKFVRSLEISLPIDAVVAFASWKLRKRHRLWAITLPLVAAGTQTSMAATQFSAGCF